MQLTIRDAILNGMHFMLSLWEPTPREIEVALDGGDIWVTTPIDDGDEPMIRYILTKDDLEAIKAGGRVCLAVPGVIHPPVFITILKNPEFKAPEELFALVRVEKVSEMADG